MCIWLSHSNMKDFTWRIRISHAFAPHPNKTQEIPIKSHSSVMFYKFIRANEHLHIYESHMKKHLYLLFSIHERITVNIHLHLGKVFIPWSASHHTVIHAIYVDLNAAVSHPRKKKALFRSRNPAPVILCRALLRTEVYFAGFLWAPASHNGAF